MGISSSFYYNSGRWDWGTGDNGKDGNMVLTVKEPTHPIFNGVTITDGQVTMLSGITSGKTLQGFSGMKSGYNIGEVPPASGSTHVVCIHELPVESATGFASPLLTNTVCKYLLISLFNGVSGNLTADGTTIIGNACEYLLGPDTFVPPTTGIDKVFSSKEIASVKYYTTTGIEIDHDATGILIVKTTYKDGSVEVSKQMK